MSKNRVILLTNDDGFRAPGILALRKALTQLGRVVMVAPSDEKSAVSHGLTLHAPLRITSMAEDVFSVDGTPADCILVSMNKILPSPPELIVSGINAGANIGDDVIYSGTVAGAREGSMYGISSIAFSLKLSESMDFDFWAEQAYNICAKTMDEPLPPGLFLNVNFPAQQPPKGIRVTRQSGKFARSSLYENNDPRGNKYYWIGEDESSWDSSTDTDFWSVTNGYISVTPLQRDQTAYIVIESLRRTHDQG